MRMWPHRWFGYWKEMGEAYRPCPSIFDWIDPSEIALYGDDFPLILHYLENAYALCATSACNFPNLISGQTRNGSLCIRTDGVWNWNDDLSDYMKMDHVAIPWNFYQHLKDHRFTPPKFAVSDCIELQKNLDHW